jgi:hypothetical protein
MESILVRYIYAFNNDNIAKCTDAKAKGVTNFNFEDDNFISHMKDKEH